MKQIKRAGQSVRSGLSLMCIVCLLCGLLCGFFWLAGESPVLAAGLDASQFSAHKLRHTAATLMLSGGVDVKTVQEVLGHENLNTTQIYTHIENTELKIAADANPISKLDFLEPEEK